MKLISVPVAAVAALAVSLPTSAFAQSSDAPRAQDDRIMQKLVDRANSLPVVADPKAATTRGPIGSYPSRKGVILVTPDKYAGLAIGHAAIIFVDGKVTESLQNGVQWGKNNWNTAKSQAYATSVRATSATQDSTASTWASNQRGKPYNWFYWDVSRRDAFYCSQLVWAAFKDNFGINLNNPDVVGAAIHPMELVNTSKVYLIYRKK